MKDIVQQIKAKYQAGEINVKLIFICVGVFLLVNALNLILGKILPYPLEHYFVAKADWTAFFSQPWGIITYVFFHGSFLHMALNLLMIYFVGQLFLRYFRKEDFLTFFFFGAISGALTFMLLSGVLNYKSSLLGASAAIYAVFFALVAYVPKTKVQLMFFNFNIPLDYVAYALLGFDVWMIFANQNIGGHISHLGGAAFGFLYMKQFEKGNDFLGEIIRALFFRPKKLKQKTTKRRRPVDDYEFNGQRNAMQKKVDVILEKISRSGYESLTKDEKDFLFKAGQK